MNLNVFSCDFKLAIMFLSLLVVSVYQVYISRGSLIALCGL